MKRNAVIWLIVVILAGTAVYRKLHTQTTLLPADTAPRLQGPAPAFTLEALDGSAYTINGKRDKPVFLNFWASWCDPCEQEAPMLTKIFDKYKDKLDLYAVNVTKNDSRDAAEAFANRYRYRFPVLLDKDMSVSDRYQLQVIPTSYLIDTEGRIVDVIHVLEADELEKKIKKLIGSAAS